MKNIIGKIGYEDISGKLIIPCQYNEASPFFLGLAKVSNDDCEVNNEGCMQSLIIDKSGKKRYDDWDLKSYSEGAIIVENDSLGFNKHTYWNINGQMFNRYWEIATPLSEGIICVSDYSPSCGIPYDYYDKNGKNCLLIVLEKFPMELFE